MTRTNPKVDIIIRKAKKWQEEMKELRRIALDCDLTEELKWRQPVYTIQDNNVLIIGAFKEYCTIGFFKGALLKDPKGILVTPGPNTQSARGIRFTSVREIIEMERILKAYIKEAVEVETAGKKVKFKKITEHAIPDELQAKFDEVPALKTAFRSLTPGRQRAYLLHFSGAKQSQTRTARIEKCMKDIFDGKGFNEEYMTQRKKLK